MAFLIFSYSHTDEALRDRLEKHLAMLKREGVIEAWHDRRIVPGSPLDPAIGAQVERADLFLCLVSADFLASDYCYDVEMTRALERHAAGQAHVLPVILRDCDWKHSPLGKLLATPRDGKPVVKFPHEDEAFLQVVEAIRSYLKAKAPAASDRTPALYRSGQASGAVGALGSPSQFPTTSPRSSNLRLRKDFTDADKHRFQEEGFEFIARYFEGSLRELQERNPGVEPSYRRIDANTFTARVFLNGSLAAQCRIYIGGFTTGGIAFSNQADSTGDGFNECLTIKADDQGLRFESMGMAQMYQGGGREKPLNHEGAAELYWSMFIEPLQR